MEEQGVDFGVAVREVDAGDGGAGAEESFGGFGSAAILPVGIHTGADG